MTSPQIKVDWTIPFWSVLCLAGQAIAVVWWGSNMSTRVDQLEAKQDRMADFPSTIARLDERGQSNQDTLRRMEAKLDAIEVRR